MHAEMVCVHDLFKFSNNMSQLSTFEERERLQMFFLGYRQPPIYVAKIYDSIFPRYAIIKNGEIVNILKRSSGNKEYCIRTEDLMVDIIIDKNTELPSGVLHMRDVVDGKSEFLKHYIDNNKFAVITLNGFESQKKAKEYIEETMHV